MDISVVIPLYNEADSLVELYEWIEKVMQSKGFSYEVIFINDGSTDRSWEIIEELRRQGHLICNLQNGAGYFLADTDEEVEQQYRQDCARAMSILRRIKPFRHYLRSLDEERGDQVTFEDMALEEIISRGEI